MVIYGVIKYQFEHEIDSQLNYQWPIYGVIKFWLSVNQILVIYELSMSSFSFQTNLINNDYQIS